LLPRRNPARASRGVHSAAVLALALTALAGCEREDTSHAVPPDSVLLNPQDDAFIASAPDTFHARFETSRGGFTVEVVSEWAPNGADRFYNLVRNGYYDGARFYRAVPNFMVQFGLHGDPAVTAAWQGERIMDDPVRETNERGMVSFASAGPDTRTTQIFINLVDNARLDEMGFAPIGRVIDGMDVVDELYTGYGEGAPSGTGPSQIRIREEGNAYLDREFPDLDHVERATITSESRSPAS
jgi:peptidyl-prolyl cis-trans isomerase A (cyclophilin A)